MSSALIIQNKLGKKVDLKLIKKIVRAYEEVSSDEVITIEQFDEMPLKKFPKGISSSEKIKTLRTREGLTQKMLAEKSYIAQQTFKKNHRKEDIFSALPRAFPLSSPQRGGLL